MSSEALGDSRSTRSVAVELELVRNTSLQLWRSHLPHVGATIGVVAFFAGQLTSNAIWWWGAVALLNNVRAVACNVYDRRILQTGKVPRRYTELNAVYYLTYGAIWGALPVVTGRYGADSDRWIGFVVLLAVVSLTAVVTAGSRVLYGATIVGALSTVTIGLVMDELPRGTFIPLLVLYFAAAWWLHRAFHQTLTALIASNLENQQLAEQLSRVLEYQDPLTLLLNRDGLTPWLASWRDPNRRGQLVAVAVGNVERLSSINELFGVDQGDAVLQSIARRLEELAEPEVALCRIAGDEFAIAVPAEGERDVARLRDTLERCMFEPFVLDGRPVPVQMSTAGKIGSPANFEQLLTGASSLVREERSQRSPSLVAADGEHRDRRELLTELRAGLADGEVTPWFQPMLSCDGQTVRGWEALVRWEHPTRGLVPPAQFLGLAEVGGLSSQLTNRVIDQSLEFVAELVAQGHDHASSVHVNLSASEARRLDLPDFIRQRLGAHGVEPASLTVEITENEVTRVEGVLLQNLQDFEAIGIGLAIDDFGTGYSSLSHLLDLRATELKIDKRFVDGLPADRPSAELVTAVLGLARGLGLRTVAEGVEQPEQLEFLDAAGCDLYQGFMTSPALRPNDALAFLADHQQPA